MEVSKIISLLIAGLYVVVFIYYGFVVYEERDAKWEEEIFRGAVGIIFWLALSLGCIWWGDELGEGLIGAKFGLISAPSPGWAVKLMGWVLLVLPAVIFVFYWIGGD